MEGKSILQISGISMLPIW